MSLSRLVVSAFGDEISPDLQAQVSLLRELGVGYLEFRSAWGTNVKDLDDEQLDQARRICAEAGIAVSCIGSPIGKSPITDPLEREIETLERVFKACDVLGTRHIRMFAFYPPESADFDAYVEPSVSRLARLTELAEREGCTLMLENDEGLVADTIVRTHAVLSAIDDPHLRLAWDPGNFVRCGMERPTTNGWDLLAGFIGTIHIKDATPDHNWRAAGEGVAEILDLLRRLDAIGYQGFLAVEPHPFLVEERGELSKAEGMTYAVQALRRVLADLGLHEAASLN
jgi:sugar phosphate isomerase/epimerase